MRWAHAPVDTRGRLRTPDPAAVRQIRAEARLLEVDGAQHRFAVHDDPQYLNPQTVEWQAFGEPLRIHRHRIRTTFANRRDKRAWTGRTTIDPNRTARVEGDQYLSRPSPAQQDALHAVIEDAQADLVRRATTAVVITSQDPVAAAQALPGQVASLHLTRTVIAELVGGQRDVFTAACADQLAGLHGPAGQPCPARPWVCLLCPLAVFAPRHAPNLLRLKAFFARQFRQMPVAQFMAVFGAYAHRLDEDILPRFGAAVLTAAAGEVADTDEELPLRPEEATG